MFAIPVETRFPAILPRARIAVQRNPTRKLHHVCRGNPKVLIMKS